MNYKTSLRRFFKKGITPSLSDQIAVFSPHSFLKTASAGHENRKVSSFKKTITLKKDQVSSTGVWLTKRHKVVIAAVILMVGFTISTQPTLYFLLSYKLIGGLAFFAYILSLWSLWEGMSFRKALILLILPVFYTIAYSNFYFLFKEIRWLTRIPAALFFGATFYFLLLGQNIFAVASSSRTIPLYRVALTASFVFTWLSAFFAFNVLDGFEQPFYINGFIASVIAFPLVLQSLWTIKMENISAQILVYSLVVSLIVGESALVLSFWPVSPLIYGLSLATVIYGLLGILTDYLRGNLTKKGVLEYIVVSLIILIFGFIATHWN